MDCSDGMGAGRPEGGRVQPLDALVVGAGFGGLYALYRFRQSGLRTRVIETGDGVGGVWHWNRYPGIRCDVMSFDYSYSFSPEIQQAWTWSEKFASGEEIRAYADFVADTLDLRRDIDFETTAEVIRFDDARRLWVIETRRGDIYEATYCIMATGPLSIPKDIDVPGQERFRGEIYRSAKWPRREVDFSGQRVGVVGTGSSGIQIVPEVAKQAEALFVFQRTPSFTLPMRNSRLDDEFVAQVKQHYPTLRAIARTTASGSMRPVSTRPLFSVPPAEREVLMEEAWAHGGFSFFGMFSDLLINEAANDIVADFVRRKIGEVVRDPVTAERLKPRGYPIFARRPCLDTEYYEAFNRPNVTLVDCLEEPILEFTEAGVRTEQREIALDALIFANGFDGLTGAMLAVEIQGRQGRSLREKWSHGARSYLGLGMAGFPNLFIVGGANGPSATANYISLNEQNVDWIVGCIEYMRASGLATVEADPDAEAHWVATVAALAEKSLIPRANTWYVGANIPGKPRVFSIYIGGFNRYQEICNEVAAAGYRGFSFEPERAAVGAEAQPQLR